MTNPAKSNPWRRVTSILFIIILFLLIAYLGIGAYSIYKITTPEPCKPEFNHTPATFGIDYQDVVLSAREDEFQIAAWYIPNPNSSKAIIIVHGRDASKQCAASGTIVEFQAALFNAGYTVLAIDLRGHGDSETARYSFGVYERRDVLGAVDFLKEKGFASGNIGVVGISLGGGAVNGAMAESADIGAVVTEGTFAEFYSVVEAKWTDESGLPNFFLPGVMLMNKIMYGYSLNDINLAEEITAAAPRPMLIMHCTSDDIIPVSHSNKLLQAAPHAETWIVTGECEHGELLRDYHDEYTRRVIDFFNENL